MGEEGKRLGVLGTFVWDTIWPPGGSERPIEQWGGLAYSLAAFSAVCPPGWTIRPITRIGADLADRAGAFLSSLPSVSWREGLRVVPEPTNRVELRYHDAGERSETLTGGVSSWTWRELSPLLTGVDALYVNFVSGLEMDLETLRSVRAELQAPIYVDLHSLFLGPPGDGPRQPRRLPDWEQWLECCDAVQLNRVVLGLLGSGGGEPPGRLEEIPSHGPLLAVVTEGGEGARYVSRVDLPSPAVWPQWRQVDPPAMSAIGRHVPAPKGPMEGDPTGCGDVWGSVNFAGLLAGYTVPEAIQRAHHAAAAKIETAAISSLSEAIRRRVNGA